MLILRGVIMLETKTIWLDMDGTFIDLYSVENWLPMLRNSDPTPYAIAPALVNLSHLARLLNSLQKQGYNIGIISWLCKGGSDEYNEMVANVKREYLRRHLPSVVFDEIIIVPYGTPKNNFNNGFDFLFDDEEQNRENWTGEAYEAERLIEILQELVRG